MFTKAIVRPPAPNFSEGLTAADLGQPDYDLALRQHEVYCTALEQCGLTLVRLEPDPAYPDSTFVEDVAVLIGALSHDWASAPASEQARALPQAVLTRPGALSRMGEVASMRQTLAAFFPALSEIQAPGTLDGGDVCDAGNHFLIGVSERTNEAGAQQLAELLKTFGYPTSFVDLRGLSDILHLKSGIAFLGDNRLAIIEALADRREFCGYDLVRVRQSEVYAANCVRINDWVLVAAGFPAFAAQLQALGYQTIALDMSEFQKMDGGLSCLSLRF